MLEVPLNLYMHLVLDKHTACEIARQEPRASLAEISVAGSAGLCSKGSLAPPAKMRLGLSRTSMGVATLEKQMSKHKGAIPRHLAKTGFRPEERQ